MSASLDMIQSELEELGYSTTRFTSSVTSKPVVAFKYHVDIGRFRCQAFEIGLSMQQEGYPTYAPHWIHIHPPPDGDIPGRHEDKDDDGRSWIALSRPPSPEAWDEIAAKNMKTYLAEHVRGFWAQV